MIVAMLDPKSITVVSGLPRSGTSMMMQMLEAGGLDTLIDEARVPDDDNPRGYFEFEPTKKTRRDTSWVDLAGGKVVKLVHLLLLDLPADRSYRVIMMRRQMSEVLISQEKMLTRQGKKGASLSPDKLAAVFHQQMEDVLIHLREQSCFEFLEIQYADVVADAAEQADAINTFLGGMLDTAAMAAAVDPNLYRNRG